MRLGFIGSKHEKRWLIVILVAGLFNGLLHLFLMPPWQHYDEPGNFEYAWLIANSPGLPNRGEYVQGMRREVAASMIEHDFFNDMGFRPNLLSITEPIWIGISQTNDVPFYYTLVAMPLFFSRYTDITFQLYSGRLISLGLLLITLLGAYAITTELTEPGNSLRLLIPATMALIPAFVNIMTAVNNDAGAAAFFTLFLWVSVRMMQRGITWLNTIALILLVVVCLFTKSTTLFVIPLAILSITLTLLPMKKRIYGWISATALLGLTIFFSVSFEGLKYWHVLPASARVNQINTELAPIGNSVLEIESPDNYFSSTAVQLIPDKDIDYLEGKTITVGAWIWSSSPIQTRTPTLYYGENTYYEEISVNTEPDFFAYSTILDSQINILFVRLQNFIQPRDNRISVFYDGIVLIEGDYTLEGSPTFFDINGKEGEWGSQMFTNHIRNPSFEQVAPKISAQVDSIFSTYLPARFSSIISSIIDFEGYRDYFISSAQHLFRSFWAVFGWGQVYLTGTKPYRILLIITLFGFIGDLIYLWKNRHTLHIDILVFLGLALIGVWGMAYTRGLDSVFSKLFIPAARYATPVIAPTVMLFVVGWQELLKIFGRWLHISKDYQYTAYISFLVVLNLISIYSIVQFYRSV